MDDDVAQWLEARATETTKSELIQHGIVEHYQIGRTETNKYGGTEDAKTLIREIISKQGEAKSEDIQQLAELMGITRATLRRAKSMLGIKSKKTGFGSDSKWYWCNGKNQRPDGT